MLFTLTFNKGLRYLPDSANLVSYNAILGVLMEKEGIHSPPPPLFGNYKVLMINEKAPGFKKTAGVNFQQTLIMHNYDYLYIYMLCVMEFCHDTLFL